MSSAALLPAATDILRAIRDGDRIDHPITRWACELAELHRQTPDDTDGPTIDTTQLRAQVVHAIDVWTQHQVPQHRHGAALHTETLGSVVDRIAATCVSADRVLAILDTDDLAVHGAWQRLAELVDGYTDLVAEVLDGRRRLPAPATLALGSASPRPVRPAPLTP